MTTIYPGSTADDIEKHITIPIDKKIENTLNSKIQALIKKELETKRGKK